MGKKNLLKDRRGISPVITTVILVAVGIAIAVAIALWMSGLVGLFTRFERIEIKNSYVDVDTSGDFIVTVIFSNTGSSDASIDSVLLNGKPLSSWTGATLNVNGTSAVLPIPMPVGAETTATLQFSNPCHATSGSAQLKSGVTLTVTLHSTGGKEYPTSVALP
jgi:flagellin-like protein